MQGQARLTTASIVHQTAAGVFFLGSIAHMGLWLQLMMTVEAGCAISWQRAPHSFYFKASCFLLSIVPLPTAFILHPSSPVRSRLELTEADEGGLQQYVLVLCVAGFFASYYLEFLAFAQLERPSRTKLS